MFFHYNYNVKILYIISLANNFGDDLGVFGDRIQLTLTEMPKFDILKKRKISLETKNIKIFRLRRAEIKNGLLKNSYSESKKDTDLPHEKIIDLKSSP